jgi:hypothetical protein
MVQEVQVRVRVVEAGFKGSVPLLLHSTVGYLTTPSHKIGTKDSGSLKFFYDSTVGSHPIRDVVRWSRLESTYIMIPWLIFYFPLVPVAQRNNMMIFRKLRTRQ